MLNGEILTVPNRTRLIDLLRSQDEPYEAGLVELNKTLVRKQDLAQAVLVDGDEIEVILPAFGG